MQFETKKRFILASQSPRRRELLGQLGIEFDVQSADVEETSVPFETAAQYVRDVALLKTRAIDATDAVVIGSDTIVVKDGQLLHKPKNHAEAVAHLKALSGTTHEVMTEARMKHFFGIELKKIIFEEDDLLLETMIPRALGLKRDISTCKFNEELHPEE